MENVGYYSTDKPYPRGELCVITKDTISGYYNSDKDTNIHFDSEGWYEN